MTPSRGRILSSAKKPAPTKRPANVSINAELLREAKEMNINLSRTLEDRLLQEIQGERRRRWLAENARAIAEYNDRVDRDGVFGAGLRRF